MKEFEKLKLELLEKRKKLALAIQKLAKKYAEINTILNDQNDEDDLLLMEKANINCKLKEKCFEHQITQKEIQQLRKIPSQLTDVAIFNRDDMVNIITYLISLIEKKQFQFILHDEINNSKIFNGIKLKSPKENQLVNQKTFPYLNEFLQKIFAYKLTLNFKYGYSLTTPLTYEELYNLANDFIDNYQNQKKLEK